MKASTSNDGGGSSVSGGGGSGSSGGGRSHNNGTSHSFVNPHGPHSSSHQRVPGSSPISPSLGVSAGPASLQKKHQKLTDADVVSFMESIRIKFENQPHIYENFIEIMEEYKLKSIDFDMVKKVAELFRGYPDCIMAFNAFAPPGYKIDVQTNDLGDFCGSVTTTSSTRINPAVALPFHSDAVHQPNTSTINSRIPFDLIANPIARPWKSVPKILTHSRSQTSYDTPAAVTAVPMNQSSLVDNCSKTPFATQGQTSTVTLGHSRLMSKHVGSKSATDSQLEDFKDAVSFVGKVKNRFQHQPEIYRSFMKILCDKKNSKETGKQVTDLELYSQIAELFHNHNDLLAEFAQYVPEVSSRQTTAQGSKSTENVPVQSKTASFGLEVSSFKTPNSVSASSHHVNVKPKNQIPKFEVPKMSSGSNHGHSKSTPGQSSTSHQAHSSRMKRSPSLLGLENIQPKKKKLSPSFQNFSSPYDKNNDALSDYSLFDEVYKSLQNPELYDNFLRCIDLYNDDMVNAEKFWNLVTPFFKNKPTSFNWFKSYMFSRHGAYDPGASSMSLQQGNRNFTANQDECALEINYSTCKRLGASYCVVPDTYVHPKCSGRTPLCEEILNDCWKSFPFQFKKATVTSRKTHDEESIFQCEDGMFELDVIIETNLALVIVLENLLKKLTHLPSEELNDLKLDDQLGGTSSSLNQRALWRLYGNKAPGVMEGLRLQPLVCAPMILKRLKSKDEEWRSARKDFNKSWREQLKKYYLKSLDHQGKYFKLDDSKAICSKSLLNEIKTIFNDRQNQAVGTNDGSLQTGPHMTFSYKHKSVLDDASHLLIYCVEHQTDIKKEDKQGIKHLIQQFIPDLFHHLSQESIDHEKEKLNDTEPVKHFEDLNGTADIPCTSNPEKGNKDFSNDLINKNIKVSIYASESCTEVDYTLFFGNDKWYYFLRLHQILCERLAKISEKAAVFAHEERLKQEKRTESIAMVWNLKPKCDYLIDIEVEDYYPAFLDLVKKVLVGDVDTFVYEDILREMFGIHAYIAFTLYNVVLYAVRQLQYLIADEDCLHLFTEQTRRAGGCSTLERRFLTEVEYQEKSKAALVGECCFKIFFFKRDYKLTMELLSSIKTKAEMKRQVFENYLFANRYDSDDGDSNIIDLTDELSLTKPSPVFLNRNAYKRKSKFTRNSLTRQIPTDASVIDIRCLDCPWNLNTFRKIFVIHNIENIYKKGSLSRAKHFHKELSRKMSEKFNQWHKTWICKNISQ